MMASEIVDTKKTNVFWLELLLCN